MAYGLSPWLPDNANERIKPMAKTMTEKKAETANQLPAGFTLAKPLLLPNLQLRPNQTAYVYVMETMEVQAKFAEQAKAEGKDAADVAPSMKVIDLETMTRRTLVVPAVIRSAFNEELQGDYVGKAFAITKSADKKGQSGRQYFTYQLSELNVPKGFNPDDAS